MLTAALLMIAFAPLPPPRPKVADPGPGEYHLFYNGSDYHVVLTPGGAYRCWSGFDFTVPPHWEGTWEKDGGEVKIKEWHANVDRDSPPLEFRCYILLPDPYRNIPSVYLWPVKRRR